jgi:PAS domain S-box-containing protein
MSLEDVGRRLEVGLPFPVGFQETPDSPLERHLAATFENAGIGIIETDAEGKLLRVNAHLRGLLGYSEQELLGRSIFELTHNDDATVDREKYRQQVAGEIDGYTLEKRFIRRDGSALWASITSRSVHDSERNFLYAVRVQQDLTARKQADEIFDKFSTQQAALHDLAAKLQHAVVLEDVYTAAIDAMFAALGCDRASVLLFDRSNVMRFVASHGLSEPYRKAVDGHSPWNVDTRNAKPVCIADVAKSDLSDEIKAVVTREGIAALAFIPLQEGEKLIGKFMIYYNAPHALACARWFWRTPLRIMSDSAWHACVSSEPCRSWLRSLSLLQMRLSARISAERSPPGTAEQSGCSAIRRQKQSAHLSPSSFPRIGSMKNLIFCSASAMASASSTLRRSVATRTAAWSTFR